MDSINSMSNHVRTAGHLSRKAEELPAIEDTFHYSGRKNPAVPPLFALSLKKSRKRSIEQLALDAHKKNTCLATGEKQTGPLSTFYTRILSPAIAQAVDPLDPTIEPRIARLEKVFMEYFESNGVGSLQDFALRGISCSSLSEQSAPQSRLFEDQSLGSWRKRGYISEGGGNFFVFHPGEYKTGSSEDISADAWKETVAPVSPLNGDDFLYLLFASCGSVSRYASRENHPVILFVDMDDKFMIPASGGNDGISGSFPWSFSLGSTDFHLYNLDVGCITRKKEKHRKGLISDKGVPRNNVSREIGADGNTPPWIKGKRLYEMSEEELLGYARWVYVNVLEHLAEKVGVSGADSPE